MPDYTVTLTSSQNDALLSLIDQLDLTAGQKLQALVNAQLQVPEQAIQAATDALLITGQAMPNVLRERMTAGLTVEQLVLLPHLALNPAQGP